MDLDELSPRPKQNILADLARQDLDPLSVDELQERIAVLEAEIERTRAKISTAINHRASADALFKKR